MEGRQLKTKGGSGGNVYDSMLRAKVIDVYDKKQHHCVS